jgi:2-(1,2-epoxy-1,2-dihydrophenyl)acetyl-CoA isomerase
MGARNADMTMLDKRKRHRWILSDILQPLYGLEKPVIAAVNGPAAGAGFNLALAADIVTASENAIFVQSFKNLALVPDLGGLYLLVRVIGLNKAKELCYTARKVGAEEGMSLGFVNHVFSADSLMDETRRIALDIANGPPTALAMIKTLLNKSSNLTLDQMLEYESFAQAVAYSSTEHEEGVTAFKEKRKPNFAGAE